MGAGHDAVAGELAGRLRARGHEARILDVLALLPSGVGPALRSGYRGSVRHFPQLYAWIYAAFLAPRPPGRGAAAVPRPGSAPLAALAERPLMNVVESWQPDAVISTFHLSAQVTGRLRRRGTLRIPSVVTVVDFAVHRGWLHPGNDAHLCVTESAAHTAAAVTGSRAEATGPVVPERFRGGRAARASGAGPAYWCTEFEHFAPGRPVVLLSSGAWGVGAGLPETAQELASRGFCPVLLCGRDEKLRRRAAWLHGTLALGWVEDMAGLMAAAHALVDNAAGQTAAQALAAGLPLIGYRPLPGHGTEGIREMAAAGVTELTTTQGELAAALDSVVRPGPTREQRIRHGRDLFRADAAQRITDLALSGVRAA